jgi:chaperonin GroES
MTPDQIQPLGDRLLVEVIKDEMTASGIHIPQMISEGRPERARVLAVGPGRLNEETGERVPMEIEVGDVVIFHRHAGTHIGGLDDDYIVFREQDILCRVLDPQLEESA